MSLGSALRNRDFVPPTLQITAMMDMFTIIVFFLLFSYSDRPDEIDLEKTIDLPVSSAERDYDNVLKVFVSSEAVKIDEQLVAEIRQGRVMGYDPEKPKESGIYKALLKIREKEIRENQMQELGTSKNDKVEAEQEDKPKMAQVLFFCDRTVPFKAINTVMKTIGMAGYPNMQFAVTGEY
ncbi:Biopolymer transport protein ExbD/TolR [Alteromonadaceae bacterium Bs31]|nr:Biopolymer transport protein ExbD/TolR [Alteromonadaceae bacterium Bs31]